MVKKLVVTDVRLVEVHSDHQYRILELPDPHYGIRYWATEPEKVDWVEKVEKIQFQTFKFRDGEEVRLAWSEEVARCIGFPLSIISKQGDTISALETTLSESRLLAIRLTKENLAFKNATFLERLKFLFFKKL